MNILISVLTGASVGVIGSLLYYAVFKAICRGSRCSVNLSSPFRLALLGMIMGAIIGFLILGR